MSKFTASKLPWWLRVLHFSNGLCMIAMIISGWAIYNAAPVFSFSIPEAWVLGLYLSDAIRWHFTLVWPFLICACLLLIVRLVMSCGQPSLRPNGIKSLLDELKQVLRLRLTHSGNSYNEIQKWLYSFAYLLMLLLIISGAAIWKPVQWQLLTELLGGFEWCRRWHIFAMAGLLFFLVVHVFMVVLVPKTLLYMFIGIENEDPHDQ